ETGSSHPLALSILAKAKKDGITIPFATDAKALGGKGVTAVVDGREVFLGSPKAANDLIAIPQQHLETISALNDEGKTVSVLIAAGQLAGAIAMRDEPRADALEGLAMLKESGVKIIMLTGDNKRTADAIGQTL